MAPPRVDLVAGPTTGGVILAFETADSWARVRIFAEEVGDATTAGRGASSGAASGSSRASGCSWWTTS